jgi:hypothetical protein
VTIEQGDLLLQYAETLLQVTVVIMALVALYVGYEVGKRHG